MAASTRDEHQRAARRKRLVKGLLIGGAAIGIPALANAWVRKQAGRLTAPTWGRPRHYAWHQGEIAFQQLGEGPPVVLLHSFGQGHDSTEWRRVAELLSKEYQVFAPDFLGWGRSSKPDLTYDGELYVQLLQDFLEDVVGDKALVVASGLSAAYAVQLGVDKPELFYGLALVCPQGLDLHGEEPDFKDAALHRLLRLPILGTAALNAFTSRAGIANHLRGDVYAAPERVDAALVDHHYRASHEPGAKGALVAYLAGYLNHGVREVLPRLSLPVWLAWGREAKGPGADSPESWAGLLPTAELDFFEGAGALPQAETPIPFCRRLTSLLAAEA